MEEERRRAAVGRTYTTPAIVTLVLYWFLWIPGIVANVVYLNAAKKDQLLTGREPEGKGCLVALLWVFGILPFVIIVLLILGGAIAVA